MSFAGAAHVAPVAVDQLSTVRYIHATAFRISAANQFSAAEIQAFVDHVYSSGYANGLSQSVRDRRLLGAYVGSELVGTSAWLPSDDTGTTARLVSVFVSPLFNGHGLGRQLVHEAEDQATRAGFESFTVRAIGNTMGFFKRLGYEVSSHGVVAVSPEHSLPVAYMRKTPVRDDETDTEVPILPN
jgi:GNAT superfamily N-acetyltransferase